jgi:hypothetical protein
VCIGNHILSGLIGLHCHTIQGSRLFKFSGQGDISTIEHINRFLAQCGEASAEEALKVRLFSLSLTGSAFTRLSSLPPSSRPKAVGPAQGPTRPGLAQTGQLGLRLSRQARHTGCLGVVGRLGSAGQPTVHFLLLSLSLTEQA